MALVARISRCKRDAGFRPATRREPLPPWSRRRRPAAFIRVPSSARCDRLGGSSPWPSDVISRLPAGVDHSCCERVLGFRCCNRLPVHAVLVLVRWRHDRPRQPVVIAPTPGCRRPPLAGLSAFGSFGTLVRPAWADSRPRATTATIASRSTASIDPFDRPLQSTPSIDQSDDSGFKPIKKGLIVQPPQRSDGE